MDTQVINTIKRFFLLVIIQVLVLKHINIGWSDFNFIHFFIYPLFILLLPLKTQRSLMLILAFIFGLIIDMFYDSPGLHAGSLVFLAYIRKYILKFLEPIEGYNIDSIPTIKSFGFNWFLIYSSVLISLHILLYFSLEAFSFQYFADIILKTIFSFIFSEIIIVLYVLIINPK